MIRYKLTEPDTPLRNPFNPRRVEVILRAENLHDWAKIEVIGHELLAEEVYQRLLNSYGFRGRSIEEETTPIDLSCAMSVHLRKYSPELVEGKEILEQDI